MQEPRKRKAGSADTLRADDDFKDGSVGRLLKYTHEELVPKRSDDSTPEDESAFLRASQQQAWRAGEKMIKHKQQHFGGLVNKSAAKMNKSEHEERSLEDHLVYEKNHPLIKKKRKKVKSGSESGDFAAAPPLLFGASLGSSKDDAGIVVPRKAAMKEHADELQDDGLVRASAKGHHLDPAR